MMANETRLIDANALRGQFRERYDDAFMQIVTRTNEAYWNGYANGINWGINTITDAPTVDVGEVVHGRWVDLGRNYYTVVSQCSECGAKYDFRSPYCPTCGAKMDGDGNGFLYD